MFHIIQRQAITRLFLQIRTTRAAMSVAHTSRLPVCSWFIMGQEIWGKKASLLCLSKVLTPAVSQRDQARKGTLWAYEQELLYWVLAMLQVFETLLLWGKVSVVNWICTYVYVSGRFELWESHFPVSLLDEGTFIWYVCICSSGRVAG